MKLAPFCFADHIHGDNSLLMKMKVISVHSTSTQYFVQVLIDKSRKDHVFVVMLILWYVGYAVNQNQIRVPDHS